jgi:hypothetical protein
VLNTLTEHKFQDAFIKMAEALGYAYTSRVISAIRSEVSFHEMAAPVPDIMDTP